MPYLDGAVKPSTGGKCRTCGPLASTAASSAIFLAIKIYARGDADSYVCFCGIGATITLAS